MAPWYLHCNKMVDYWLLDACIFLRYIESIGFRMFVDMRDLRLFYVTLTDGSWVSAHAKDLLFFLPYYNLTK